MADLRFPYGAVSHARLMTCHTRLQGIFQEVAQHVDTSIICGHRNELEQHTAFITDRSQVDWPNSKHNSEPSIAVDAAVYPIRWNDTGRQRWFAGLVCGIALMLGPDFELRWGGDWDGDPDTKNGWEDLWHFELLRP